MTIGNMIFTEESAFEQALIDVLSHNGWESKVLKNPSEKDLIENWRQILSHNNKNRDCLNGCPLTNSEMQQILDQIAEKRTPVKLNGFINGKTVAIKRDNPNDKDHLGKEVSLKIYERNEIAAGQSRYQIAQQPILKRGSDVSYDRRGDLMLLINGMPVIHIELKKSGVPVSQALYQISNYSKEGVLQGLFSLIQVFVAMTPSETRYFANPGVDGEFNPNYQFHWADFNNEPVNVWSDIASSLLSIPLAHQLIGFYTVADNSDGILKVMRSYQYWAASAVSAAVSKIDWTAYNSRGGYVWHTTGAGKTMTSFKSAQLIASSKDADKVVFLMDRVELGTQSLNNYKAFKNDYEEVQATENTGVLIAKLKDFDSSNTLIVTSIQKMSRIKDDGLNAADLAVINTKRIVFIVDEAHRSTFGEMLLTIKRTLPKAVFFGFTGTPILDENQKGDCTTSTIFGNELHRYSIADGIRDGNVLGFDPCMVLTFKDNDVRRAVALEKAKADSEDEALSDPSKSKVYYHYMALPMASYVDSSGKVEKGIEDFIPSNQYLSDEHQDMVVEDITSNWKMLSRNGRFHAIFATSSIHEAIIYYRKLKIKAPKLKIACLFDPNIDNNEGGYDKEEGLEEIIHDYNSRYGQSYDMGTFTKMKKDISDRLAHKNAHKYVERAPNKQIDLLVVVDQMLTGFDSKWLNTLYLDKKLEYESIIQAFSRTNRVFGNDKPFGIIRYYRKPHTMEKNIRDAVKLYSGDKPLGLFVDKLPKNIENLNSTYEKIKDLYVKAGRLDFEKLPEDQTEKAKYASLFREFNHYLESAKLQGFSWNQRVYEFDSAYGKNFLAVEPDEETYFILVKRYKELSTQTDEDSEDDSYEVPYDIDGYITEIDTGKIDSDYMNSRFDKYLKVLKSGDENAIRDTLVDLHKSFASMSQEEQKYANMVLFDIQSGNLTVEVGKNFSEYVIQYQAKGKNDQLHKFAATLGLNEDMLREMMKYPLTEANLNEYGRYDALFKSMNKAVAKRYLDTVSETPIKSFQVDIKVNKYLRRFLLQGGFDLVVK